MREQTWCHLCLNTDKRKVPATCRMEYPKTYREDPLDIFHVTKEIVIIAVCDYCKEIVTDSLDEAGISWEELPLTEDEKVLLT